MIPEEDVFFRWRPSPVTGVNRHKTVVFLSAQVVETWAAWSAEESLYFPRNWIVMGR